MADVRNYIRINPLDISDRAVGVSLPFNAEAVFNSTYTTKEQLKSNLLNIILTEPGERVFKPDFGVGLRTYLFENFTDKSDLKARIKDQISKYAPQAKLQEVTINKDKNSHQLNISVFYIVKANNELNAIQINISPDNTGGGAPGY